MREIRFRGKTINLYKWAQKGNWVYGGIVLNRNDAISCITENPFTGDMESIEVDSASIGQYTGLRDVRGDFIYEGDIIKQTHKCGREKKSRIYYVQFNQTRCAFEIYHKAEAWAGLYQGYEGEYEVIGNIYDNPELLNGDANG